MTKVENGPAPTESAGASLTPAHNPRYANWARVNGRTPEEQLEQDRKAWPGGSMTGFSLWNSDRLMEFSGEQPECFMPSGHGSALIDHAAYDAWLDQWVPS